MMPQWIEDLRRERVKPAELARKARQRARVARGEGVERLWTLQVEALERLGGALENAPSVPGLSRVASAAERIVHKRLEATTAVQVSGYDELNAKQVREKLRDLAHVELLRLRRYEAGNKNRKSVLGEIEKELGRRVRPLVEPIEEAVAS